MIRRVILVAMTAVGSLVALAWATSYYSFDRRVDPPSRLHSLMWDTNGNRACYYVTSLRGWLRFGTVRVELPSSPLPPLDDRATWVWLGSRTWPEPRAVKIGLGTAHFGGLLVIGSLPFDSVLIAGFAVPHWIISLLLLTYPILAFIRGPLRRRRRRKRGLCPSCGYNLSGNTTGVCPECAAKVIAP